MKEIDLLDDLEKRRTFGYFDDFMWYISPHMWTLAGSGTASITANVAGGILGMATGAVNNQEVIIASTNATLLFAADKPIIYECRMSYVEANTSDAGIALGFSSAFATGLLQASGGAPATTMSGALFYKVKAATVWSVISSKTTTQTTNVSTITSSGATYNTYRIECRTAASSTNIEVVFSINGQQVLDTTTGKPVKHIVASASASAMKFGMYALAGGANSEVPNIDYVCAYQLR